MDIPAVDLGRKVDPGELAEWDLAEWRHLPPHPTHPFTHAKTHKRTHQVRAQVSVKRERERETQTDVPRRMSEGRERESSVSQAHRALQTQPQSRHVQFNEDLTSTTETDPNQRIYYTRPTCVFFSPPSLPPPNHRWRTCQGKTRNKNEQTGEERRRKERKKKKDLRTDFFPPRYFPRDSPAI